MARRTDSAPRLLGDTARTFAALGIAMGIVMVGSFGYGLAAALRGLPLRGLVYYSGCVLITFIVFFVVYQLLTFRAWRRADADQLPSWARRTTPRTAKERRIQFLTGTGARSWAITAAVLALLAVLGTALTDQLRTNPVILAMSLVAVATSWTMIAFTYALAYLRADVERGGLVFVPDDESSAARPVWSDYFYLAVQVSTTFSTSDVEVTTTKMRRLVTGHTLIAFVFNTVIVALLVSLLLISAS